MFCSIYQDFPYARSQASPPERKMGFSGLKEPEILHSLFIRRMAADLSGRRVGSSRYCKWRHSRLECVRCLLRIPTERKSNVQSTTPGERVPKRRRYSGEVRCRSYCSVPAVLSGDLLSSRVTMFIIDTNLVLMRCLLSNCINSSMIRENAIFIPYE